MRNLLLIIVLFVFGTCSSVMAQSVSDFQRRYSGNTCWDASSGTMTIKSSGYLNFQGKNNPSSNHRNGAGYFIWNVPTSVNKIVIESCVTVNAAFHSEANLTIEGENRRTSIIYGTEIQDWEDNSGAGAITDIYRYSALQNFGGTLTVNNLTILNPKGYAIRSWARPLKVSDVNVIDTRGGSQNHSDGFLGGAGTEIDNCYFETGDDNIKVYFPNMSITNCTFNMVENSVPIQLGWGSYSNGGVGNFSNIRVVGSSGRYSAGNAVIGGGQNGSGTVNVNIDGLFIDNPNGTMVNFRSPGQALEGTITNAKISLSKYWGPLPEGGNKNNNSIRICGSNPPGGNPSPYNANCTSTNYGGSTVDAYAVPACIEKTATGKINTIPIVNNTTICEVNPPVNGKPNIWIHTDMTGAYGYEVNGNKAEALTDADSDPDDQVALAMYLMLANKFNTKAIILSSTTRNLSRNTLDHFQQSHGDAYEAALPCLNAQIGGYPTLEELNVKWSSLTDRAGHLSFDNSPQDKYDNFNTLPQTVKDLINELKKSEYSPQNPLYVLVWGPMTEVSMATKHMIRNNMTTELGRLFVVSHWTSSFLSQTGTPCNAFPSDQIQFNPANCNQNCEACAYVHNEAKKSGADFRFVDVGAVGQNGIVNGSADFFTGGNNGVEGPQYQQFQNSELGDVFVKSKFGFGKPDGSDCATFITVLGEYGVTLNDYNNNGVLTEQDEINARNTYRDNAPTLMQDLLNISDVAASANCDENPLACGINVAVAKTDATCDSQGTVNFTVSDYGGRTGIKYKVGNQPYSATVSTSESYTVGSLLPGTYQLYAQWGNGDCTDTEVATIAITEDCDPGPVCDINVSTTITDVTCDSQGTITFAVSDYGGRTGIKYKVNNQNYSTIISTSGSYVVDNLSSGTYQLYAQWGNGDCLDTEVGTVTIVEDCVVDPCAAGAPTATFSTSNPGCNATDGSIVFTFPDTDGRTNIEFSNDGGATYPLNIGDDAGNASFEGLAEGTYELYVRWGNNECPVNLGTAALVQPTCDCAGVPNGTASIDACGICSGGTTGITPSSPSTWYADIDNDGVGETSDKITSCTQPTGYVAIAGDNCPNDINKTSPGECGCGVSEEDCTVTGNECNNANPYQSGAVYNEPFTKVIYEGKLYQNKWYTTGNNPDNVNGPWELIGFCTAAPLDCNGKAVWNVNSSYSTPGTEVAHEGSLYANEWYTQGQEPGTNDAWRYLGPCAPQASLMMEATSTLEVYPNPFKNSLTVSIASSIEEVRIQDILGNELIVSTQSGEQSLRIATHTLPSGTYTLTVVTEAGTYQMSVIKLQ